MSSTTTQAVPDVRRRRGVGYVLAAPHVRTLIAEAVLDSGMPVTPVAPVATNRADRRRRQGAERSRTPRAGQLRRLLRGATIAALPTAGVLANAVPSFAAEAAPAAAPCPGWAASGGVALIFSVHYTVGSNCDGPYLIAQFGAGVGAKFKFDADTTNRLPAYDPHKVPDPVFLAELNASLGRQIKANATYTYDLNAKGTAEADITATIAGKKVTLVNVKWDSQGNVVSQRSDLSALGRLSADGPTPDQPLKLDKSTLDSLYKQARSVEVGATEKFALSMAFQPFSTAYSDGQMTRVIRDLSAPPSAPDEYDLDLANIDIAEQVRKAQVRATRPPVSKPVIETPITFVVSDPPPDIPLEAAVLDSNLYETLPSSGPPVVIELTPMPVSSTAGPSEPLYGVTVTDHVDPVPTVPAPVASTLPQPLPPPAPVGMPAPEPVVDPYPGPLAPPEDSVSTPIDGGTIVVDVTDTVETIPTVSAPLDMTLHPIGSDDSSPPTPPAPPSTMPLPPPSPFCAMTHGTDGTWTCTIDPAQVFAPSSIFDASIGMSTPMQGPLPFTPPPAIPSWVFADVGSPGGGIDNIYRNGTSDWDWFISH